MNRAEARDLFWLLLYGLALIGLGIGLRDPWPADEPRFVLVAQQMLSSGEWWFPHRGLELYADKPPFFFWLLAASHWLTGGWRGSFLLPSLLAALATVVLTWDLARRLWGREVAVWAGGALLVCVHFVFHARRAQIDPTLVLLTTLSLYGLLRHLLLGPDWRWFWAGCFAAGLGVIAKGVGFLPLLALLPWWLMRRGGWSGLAHLAPGNRLRWWLGGLAFGLALALWLVPVVSIALIGGQPEHRAYLEEILFRQTAVRYADAWMHRQPAWYFLEVIAFAWLPLSLALPWLIRPWRDAWRHADARVWLPLAWAGLVLVFFTLSSGKRDVYILPALPAIALAAAPWLAAVAARPWPRRLGLGLYGFVGLALIGGSVWALTGTPEFAERLVNRRGLDPGFAGIWWLTLVTGAILLLVLVGSARRSFLTALLAAQLVLFASYGLAFYPLLDASSSGRQLMHEARDRAGPETTIGLVGWREQMLLQRVGPVVEFGFSVAHPVQWRRGLTWLGQRPDARALLVEEAQLGACVDRSAAVDLGVANRRHWWLVPGRAARDCPGPGTPPAERRTPEARESGS